MLLLVLLLQLPQRIKLVASTITNLTSTDVTVTRLGVTDTVGTGATFTTLVGTISTITRLTVTDTVGTAGTFTDLNGK